VRVELAKLLHEREIVDPTRIVSATISQEKLRIVVCGHPWWRDLPHPYEEQSIELTFEGVGRGTFDVEDMGGVSGDWETGQALEAFEIRAAAEVDWAQSAFASIYCSGPLRDPLRLYMLVHDFLVRAGACCRPDAFLNLGSGELSQFVDICTSRSFLVARGPDCIRQIVCKELVRQGVAHNVIDNPGTPSAGFLVRLGSSHFFCRSAFAEYGE
jgi:hypothetical protein